MATGSSIVGTWNPFIDWGGTGNPVIANQMTFNADGSWTYSAGGGRWIQVECMCFFNLSKSPGLIFTANTTRDTMSGIMGFALAGNKPDDLGVWWATRPGAPTPSVTAEQAAAAVAPESDLLIGPPRN